MLGKTPHQNQSDLFKSTLEELVNPKHSLVQLARTYPWHELEKQWSGLYSNTGQPSKPIRLMAGLLLLKQLENLSDERVVEQWVQNPYMQYFCGEQYFQWRLPCDPTDLVHFRKRIGEKGMELIFRLSVDLHKDRFNHEDDVLADTTVQEKNITFPTDTKLHLKIISRARDICEREGIKTRQSYVRVVQQLRQQIKFGHHPRRKKQARRAQRKIKTIAGRLYRELFNGLNEKGLLDHYDDLLGAMGCILEQQRGDGHKIYSLHEPSVSCIAKGKAHKPYEFGNKVSLVIHSESHVIVGVRSFTGNPYDGHTLAPSLEHVGQTTGFNFARVAVDRGYASTPGVEQTQVVRPQSNSKVSRSERTRRKRLLRKRAGIEAIISHVKHDHRMLRNYLKGIYGDLSNAMLACAAFNLKKWMEWKTKSIFGRIREFILQIIYSSQSPNRVSLRTFW